MVVRGNCLLSDNGCETALLDFIRQSRIGFGGVEIVIPHVEDE
jgi:hypothetical protein